ncbi:MAG: DNA repair protein RecN [Actinobacteria bacterium]|nr:DNA repair protein RecN [Actinomycetota bacterium]
MLVELSVENLGVIESARVDFGGGFTALTGETGAGKTMLVEAIGLVVGRRADADVIRAGCDEARVDARFTRSDGSEVILTRIVQRGGKSRAYVNGRMATVASLAEVGTDLLDIHGQHAHQRLLGVPAQRGALDAFAGIDLSDLFDARDRVAECEAALAAMGGDDKSRAREIDLLSFQCTEIDSAGLEDDEEDVSLDREESLLTDVVRTREALLAASEAIVGEDGASGPLGAALTGLRSVDGLSQWAENLSGLIADLVELGRDMRTRGDAAEENPERLAQIRERRQSLRDLRRKYGDTLADVRHFGVEARARLDLLEGWSERVSVLEAERKRAHEALARCQRVVGGARRKAAPELAEAVQGRLKALAMAHARLTIAVGDESTDPAGDAVTFMLAANPGAPALPLSKVASGGELARTMLALRLVLAGEAGTMVFDEVDAGIGGEAAVAVARALRELGGAHQVFAVTHLPQVAAAAHQQVSVVKTVRKGSTTAETVMLAVEARAAEIARMISGGVADGTATAHARDLLASLGSDREGN